MQDLNALGPWLQLDLLRDWPKLALDRDLWRGLPVGDSFVGAFDTSLLSFSFSFSLQVFSNSSSVAF